MAENYAVSDFEPDLSETEYSIIRPDHFRDSVSFKVMFQNVIDY